MDGAESVQCFSCIIDADHDTPIGTPRKAPAAQSNPINAPGPLSLPENACCTSPCPPGMTIATRGATLPAAHMEAAAIVGTPTTGSLTCAPALEAAIRFTAAPAPTPDTVIATFEAALHHEQRVSRAIHDLYAKALEAHDYASLPLLQWFVNEQVEEENTVSTILDRLRMVGDDRTGLLFLDRELGQRSGNSAASTAEPEGPPA